MNVAVIVRGMFKRLFKEIAFEKDPSWIGLHIHLMVFMYNYLVCRWCLSIMMVVMKLCIC